MIEFRVTKYDPALRDDRGVFTRTEWTSVSDIGRSFGGVVLTEDCYRCAEDAYVTAAIAFLRESGSQSLAIVGLENHSGVPLPFSEGVSVGLDGMSDVLRRMLREECWCRLESAEAFIHVGYDFNMYIGMPSQCPAAEAMARNLGLFVEPFQSPYRENGD